MSPFDSNIACLCQSIENNNNKHVYRQSQVRMPNGISVFEWIPNCGVKWAECSLIIGTGCRVQVFSLILDSSVGLSVGIQSAGDLVSEILMGSNPAFSRGTQLVSFPDSNIACLCQSIEINNNKHVCVYVCMDACMHVCMYVCMYDVCMYVCMYVCIQSQVRMPNGSGVRWAECLLIIGTSCRVQVFSLILDNSVALSAGIQSAEDWVSETLWVRILHSAEEDNLSPFDSKIACLCQSIEINNNKYVCMYVSFNYQTRDIKETLGRWSNDNANVF